MTVVEQEITEIVTETERRARVLEAAALELEVRGRCTASLENPNGTVCLLGALAHAQGIPIDLLNNTDRAWDIAAIDWLGKKDPDTTDLLWKWNDHQERTEDVTFLLRWRAQEIRDGH